VFLALLEEAMAELLHFVVGKDFGFVGGQRQLDDGGSWPGIQVFPDGLA
jgi:hypothetical protein